MLLSGPTYKAIIYTYNGLPLCTCVIIIFCISRSASVDIDPQLKQKLIEEENKRKKAIIEQALLDRLV